jgi:hypothetical protein
MSNKKLTILGIIAAVMIILVVIQARIANRPAATAVQRTYLIQGLSPDKIARIEVKSGDNSVKLQRTGATFAVTDKDNYPAKSSRINELLSGLMDIKSNELITTSSANHADLEVAEDNAQYVVKLFDQEDQLVTGAVIGKRTESGDTYVRLVNSDDVYLASNVSWRPSSPIDYVDPLLLQLNKDDIASVIVTDANGVSYTLNSESGSSEVALAGLVPEGKELNNQRNSVFSALTNLRFDDVMKGSSAGNDLIFNRTYLCKLYDSTTYIIKIAKSDDKTWARCSANFADTEEVTIDISKKESDEELKRKEAILLAREAVDRFNRKCKGWVYSIQSWKADNLTKPLDELFDDIEQQSQTDTTE